MARLPPDLLSRSAEEGARLVALAYLDEIARAEHRLANAQDSEALHDFRVGLRRLRTSLRAYRASLQGSVSRKMRRRLRNLTLATNAGRDSEVQLGWLRQRAGQLAPGETEGLTWLVGRLEERQFDARAKVTAGVAARFDKLASKLRPRLETVQLVVRTGRGRPLLFSDITRARRLKYVEQLGEHLELVRDGEAVAEAHAARIAAKRLRYLWEPLSRRVPRARALVGRLKQLQDVLGEVHDMQVLTEEITASLAQQKSESPSGTEPGLRTLRRMAQEQAGLSFTSFQAKWSNGRAAGFLHRAAEVGQSLVSEDQARVGYSSSPVPVPALKAAWLTPDSPI
jgi:CHAD domain-containing protein